MKYAPQLEDMVYSSGFSNEVKRRLEGLKQAIDRDLVALEGTAPNISFGQADEILSGTDSVLASYKSAMRPLYAVTGRPSYSSRSPTARRSATEGPRGKVEPAALETIQQQGYLIDKEFVARYGFNRNAVSRKLQQLAQQYNWKRDRTAEGWRYAPVTQTPPAESALPAGELASGPGVSAVEPPAQAPAPETPTAAESAEPPKKGARRRRGQSASQADGSDEVGSHE